MKFKKHIIKNIFLMTLILLFINSFSSATTFDDGNGITAELEDTYLEPEEIITITFPVGTTPVTIKNTNPSNCVTEFYTYLNTIDIRATSSPSQQECIVTFEDSSSKEVNVNLNIVNGEEYVLVNPEVEIEPIQPPNGTVE